MWSAALANPRSLLRQGGGGAATDWHAFDATKPHADPAELVAAADVLRGMADRYGAVHPAVVQWARAVHMWA